MLDKAITPVMHKVRYMNTLRHDDFIIEIEKNCLDDAWNHVKRDDDDKSKRPSNDFAHSQTKRPRNPNRVPKIVFKVIIAAQVVILVSMWKMMLEIIPSPRFGRMQLHANVPKERTNGRSSEFWYMHPLKQEHVESRILNDGGLASSKSVHNSNLPTLVIGGSDGSGTRSFADAVRRLGVPMKMDLKSNLDIQSAEIFQGQGFPPLVNLVLKDTRSVNYEVNDLTNNTRRVALRETRKFKQGVDRWKMGVQQRLQGRATKVSIGFKAPATMLLLPLLKQVFGPIRFIHVVRDGRDVSLSTNQSPVKKFYNSTYPDASERRSKYSNGYESVLAMHLWNDWNTQALEWEKAHTREEDFDFIVVRSEDLVDPKKKFETLSKLADFVGSPMTPKDVCCLSREEPVDLGESVNWTGSKNHRRVGMERRMKDNALPLKYGSLQQRKAVDHGFPLKSRIGRPWGNIYSHPDDWREVATHHSKIRKDTNKKDTEDKSPTESPPKVNQRYGKWKSILKDKPEVSSKLHEEGATGLATFGYEPFQAYFGGIRPPAHDFACDRRIVCG